MMDEKSVKERIRKYRKRSRLSQKEMADRLGISRTAYIALETGETRLFNANLQKIAGETGTSLEELVLGYHPVKDAATALEETRERFDERLKTLTEDYERRLREKDRNIELLNRLVKSHEDDLKTKDSIISMLQK